MSRVLFSLAIVVALAAVSSALSCARCRPEQLENVSVTIRVLILQFLDLHPNSKLKSC